MKYGGSGYSKSEPSLELEIESDCTIRPFMLEPQHGTSTEESKKMNSDTMESDADRTARLRLGNRDW